MQKLLIFPDRKKAGRTKKLYVALAVLFLLVLACGAYLSCGGQQRGQLLETAMQITARADGQIALRVKAGQLVNKGDVLFTLDTGDAKVSLADEEAKLAAMEALLPVGHSTISKEALDTSEARLRTLHIQESKAREDLNDASAHEAKAALDLRKMKANGSAPSQAIQQAEARYSEAKNTTAHFRRVFDETSSARVAVERERNTMNKLQAEQSLNATPENIRIKAYAAQQARVEAARQRYESMVVRSEAKGIIDVVNVKDGDRIDAGQGVLTLLPTGDFIASAVFVMDAATARQMPDVLPVQVSMPAYFTSPLDGVVASVASVPPAEGGILARFMPEQFGKAKVVVFVNISSGSSVLPAGTPVELILPEKGLAERGKTQKEVLPQAESLPPQVQ